jgi:hypothetical protein
MTKKKDLKKRVRARQAKTGESYTTALAHLREPQIPEAPNATAEAQAEGFHCHAVVSPKLRAVGDLRSLFARLREMLEGLGAEACGPLFRGERMPCRMPQMSDLLEARRFLQSRERGLSPNGRLFALSWNGHTVAGAVLLAGRKPLLQMGLLEGPPATWWPAELLLAGIGG